MVTINMVTVFVMSAKVATLSLYKIKVFWNKGYDVIISVCNVTSKILSRNSNYIVDMVMWPKFANFMKEVIITSILYGFDQNIFLIGSLGSSSIIWDWHKVWSWNFKPLCQRVKIKVALPFGNSLASETFFLSV